MNTRLYAPSSETDLLRCKARLEKQLESITNPDEIQAIHELLFRKDCYSVWPLNKPRIIVTDFEELAIAIENCDGYYEVRGPMNKFLFAGKHVER